MVEKRYIQIMVLTITNLMSFFWTYPMSIAIIGMTNSTSHHDSTNESNFKGEFNWTSKEIGSLLNAFMVGNLFLQIPFGFISNLFSDRWLLSTATLASALIHLSTPKMAREFNWFGVWLNRVLLGVVNACFPACTTNLLSKWAPLNERAKMSTIISTSSSLANVISLPIAGLIASSEFGWPGIFYIFGGISVFWSFIMMFLLADSPRLHSSISEREKALFENDKHCSSTDEMRRPPLLKIATSVPVWAATIACLGGAWTTVTLMQEVPLYLNSVLKFNVRATGFLSSLPNLMMWIMGFPFSILSDFAIKRGISVPATRKICNTIGSWGPAVIIFFIGYVEPQERYWFIVMLVIASGLKTGTHCGHLVNLIDLSPNFAGLLRSITHTIGTVSSIGAPFLWGQIVTDRTNRMQWKIIFIVSALLLFFTNFVFIIFGSGKLQPWNDVDKKKSPDSSINESTSVEVDSDKKY